MLTIETIVEIRKQDIYDTSVKPQFILPPACVSCCKLQLQDLALLFFSNSWKPRGGVLQINQPVNADKVLKLMVRIIPALQDV